MYERPLRIAAMLSGMFVLVMLTVFGYFRSVIAPLRSDTPIVVESPLLPDGWNTYHDEQWSIGYPDDYAVKKRTVDGAVYFIPDGIAEKKTYLFVQRQDMHSLSEVKIARKTEEYPDPVDVRIANYEALKYTLGTGRVEYMIAYGSTIYLIASDEPQNPDVSTMFVTFAFE